MNVAGYANDNKPTTTSIILMNRSRSLRAAVGTRSSDLWTSLSSSWPVPPPVARSHDELRRWATSPISPVFGRSHTKKKPSARSSKRINNPLEKRFPGSKQKTWSTPRYPFPLPKTLFTVLRFSQRKKWINTRKLDARRRTRNTATGSPWERRSASSTPAKSDANKKKSTPRQFWNSDTHTKKGITGEFTGHH